MKTRPILFSAPMVRALLDGTKTQTRRVVKPWEPRLMNLRRAVPDDVSYLPHFTCYRSTCPYGQPGDRLWVREAWRRDIDKADGARLVHYRADDAIVEAPRTYFDLPSTGWTPSIHMPRWASRITLEITGVRVERLNEISEADAQAEGCESLDAERYDRDLRICPTCGGTRLYTAFSGGGAMPDTDCMDCDTYVKRYRHLWESINGEGSWAANPWVWVVEFKRLETAA